MDIFTIYIAMFFIIFLIMPLTYFTLRFLLWLVLEYCGCAKQHRECERDQQHVRNPPRRTSQWGLFYDRQGNIFTISDETSANTAANRYPDFFYLEPNSEEAARIRAQLEKDDKDLPSYEDVIRMTSLPAATLPASDVVSPVARNATISTAASSSLNNLAPPPTPPPDVPVPPYSEVPPSYANSTNNEAFNSSTAASTSRGASITIPIHGDSCNTNV